MQATGLTPRAGSTVYRGEGLTIIVKAADGVLRGLTSLARRRGRPLPEVGDEAWSLNRGRTAVLRVGELTAKVTIGGSAARSLPPDALPKLAATVAERLPAHASSQRAQTLPDAGSPAARQVLAGRQTPAGRQSPADR